MDIEYSSDSKQQPAQKFSFFNPQNMNQPSFHNNNSFFGSNPQHPPQSAHPSQQSNSNFSSSSNTLREKYFLSDDEEDEYKENEVCQEEDIDMFADNDPSMSQLVPESQSKLRSPSRSR